MYAFFYLLKIVLKSNFFWINDSDMYQKCNKKNQFFLSFIAVCHSKSNNEDYKRHSMENLELDNCSNSRIFFLLLHNRGLDKLQLWQNKYVFWWTCHTRTTGSDSLSWKSEILYGKAHKSSHFLLRGVLLQTFWLGKCQLHTDKVRRNRRCDNFYITTE